MHCWLGSTESSTTWKYPLWQIPSTNRDEAACTIYPNLNPDLCFCQIRKSTTLVDCDKCAVEKNWLVARLPPRPFPGDKVLVGYAYLLTHPGNAPAAFFIANDSTWSGLVILKSQTV